MNALIQVRADTNVDFRFQMCKKNKENRADGLKGLCHIYISMQIKYAPPMGL